MAGQLTITCCCCKRQARITDDSPSAIAGWKCAERKAYCASCVADFTEEDRDWFEQPPATLGPREIALLIPGDVEPL